jgi:formylmethanofuran dehydrogenase subunit B
MTQTFAAVGCPVCGCVCDDLRVTTAGGAVAAVERACRLSEPWFLAQRGGQVPEAFVGGRPATLGEAVAAVAALLRPSRRPVIFGLSRSTTAGQRAAVALADRLGAVIDTTASTGHAPSILALQQVGESTCTLGEVKQRADLVLFWGCDPVTTHPRHLERYVPPTAEVVAIDAVETATARIAGRFLPVDPGRDWELLWALRQLVAGFDPRDDPGPAVRQLADRMRAAKFGVVFFGGGLVKVSLAHRTIEALLQLVTDLNRHTRFYARRLRRSGDVAGADSVLAWQTGYPFGVDLARGFPRYNPGEFTAPGVLARGEADVCLLVGSDAAADLPAPARRHLGRIPVVALDPPGTVWPGAAVRVTTAVYGVHRPGTSYRLDEVPIPLRPILPTNLPDDGEVLAAVLAAIGAPAA